MRWKLALQREPLSNRDDNRFDADARFCLRGQSVS